MQSTIAKMYRTRIKCNSVTSNSPNDRYTLFKLPLYRSPNRVMIPSDTFRILVNDQIYEHIKETNQFGFITDFTDDPSLVTVVDHVFKSHSKIGTVAVIQDVERKSNHMNALTVKGIQRFSVLNIERNGVGIHQCDIALSAYFGDADQGQEAEVTISNKENEICTLFEEIKDLLSTGDVYLPQIIGEYMPNMPNMPNMLEVTRENDMTDRDRQEIFSFELSNMVSDLSLAERLVLLQSQSTSARFDWIINNVLKPNLYTLKALIND
jgi:hypothetical protein